MNPKDSWHFISPEVVRTPGLSRHAEPLQEVRAICARSVTGDVYLMCLFHMLCKSNFAAAMLR